MIAPGPVDNGHDSGASPQAVHNLPERNNHFTGRVEILDKIQEALAAKSRIAGLTQVEGISGLGGIGKTQTALEFAWQRLGNPYRHVFWARADTEAEIVSAFIEIARKLDLPQKDARETDTIIQAARAWFATQDRWLLVLDNVEWDGQQIVRDFMPRGGNGHILVTSRAHALDALDIHRPIPLDKMTPDEARDFLVGRTGNQEAGIDTGPVDAVAKALDYLPLALEQAGAYIVEKACTFADYLKSFEQRRAEYLRFKSEDTDYPDTVATTWLMNFDQVTRESKAARDLLYLCAFLDPDRIPLEILRDGAAPLGRKLAAALANAQADPIALNDLLHPLTRYSLVRRDLDDDSLSIHRLVQDVIRTRMAKKDQRAWAERAVLAVNAAFPDDIEFRDWPRCERLLPHARLAALYIDQHGFESGPIARLLNQTGYYLDERARYVEAEPLYRRALAIDETSYGPDHPEVATDLNNLATLLQATNRLAEAEPLMRRALAIDEAFYGPDHPDVARDLNNLAVLLQDTNRLAEAEPLMRRALATDEASYGPDHPNVALRLNNLAQLLKATNRLDDAEPLMRRALAIDEGSYGPDHPNVAIRLNNLAQLLTATNRIAEAEPLMRRALAIDEASYAPDHPNVARALNNLATLLQVTNRLAEAEPLMRRALAIDESSYGPDHPKVAIRLNNLAQLLRDTNRLTEAEPLMRRALAIDEASYGPDHPKVAIRLNNLARLLQDTNRLAEAEPLMRRALAINEASYGPDHPNVAICLNNLALLLQDTNRLDEAEPLMRRHVLIFRKFGEDTGHRHPHMITAVLNYLRLLRETGLSEAKAFAKVIEASGLTPEQIAEASNK